MRYVTERDSPLRPRDGALAVEERITYLTQKLVVDPETGEARLQEHNIHIRPRSRDFGTLVAYVTSPMAADEETKKVLAIQTQGVHSVATAPAEMQAVARQNSRIKASSDYHCVLSWREGEHPTPEQAFAAGQRALAALGMAEHQYVMAIHTDTENVHLHIAANRVHPETFRAVDVYRDYVRLDRACREVELEQGWSHERGIHLVREGRIEKAPTSRSLHVPAHLSARARDMRAWSDERPFSEMVQMVAEDLKTVLASDRRSWDMVHGIFAEFGLRLESKGSGLIVVDRADPTHVAKASQIARFASRARLEAVLGKFEPDRMATAERAEPIADGPHETGTPEESRVKTSGAPTQPPAFGGYGAYLVDDDDRRRAERGAELLQHPRLVLDDLFQRSATITTGELRRAIVAEVANADQAEHVWSALEELATEGKLLGVMDAAAHVVDADDDEKSSKKRDDGPRWTTSEMLALERELEQVIRKVAARERGTATTVDAAALDALTLRAGQRAAVERVLRGEMLVTIEGHAGSGKSYAFGTMRDLLPSHEFVGLAQGGQAAWELEKSSGIRSRTIASFVRGVRDGAIKIEKPTAIVLDEANLVGTREMLEVMRIARDHHMPIFIAGDGSQLPGVAAGGAFRMLTGMTETTTIGEVVRLHGWRRDAADWARDGKTIGKAVAMYAERGFLHEAATNDDAIEKIVDVWLARSEALEGRLLIAFRNEDVAALNSEARMRLRERGVVGDGIRVATGRNGELEFAVGDRITFTRNDDELRVRNGTLGTVLAADGTTLRVRLDGNEARDVVVDTEQYHHLGYGYAVTAYKAEGMTVSYAAWLATRADSQSSAYVALSRSKDDCDIVISQKEFTFARSGDGEGGAQDFQRNLSFLLERERVKDLATEYPLRDGSAPLRSAEEQAKDRERRYTMQPQSPNDIEQIRRRVGQDRFDQWFVAAPGRDLQAVLLSEDPGVRSWGMIHAVLEANGVCVRRRNGGLIFADAQQPNRWKCKASTLPRAFHLAELERVCGSYQEPDEEERSRYRVRAEALREDRRAATAREVAANRQASAELGERADSGEAREALYQRYLGERSVREARNIVWERQRESERDRHAAITREKHRMRDEMAKRLSYRAARSIATAWAAEQREALRATIDEERKKLNSDLVSAPASSWRAFVVQEAEKGDPIAQAVLRGMKMRDGSNVGDAVVHRKEFPEAANALEVSSNRRPQAQEIVGMRCRIHENGDVSYSFSDLHSRVFGGVAFVDRGPRVTIESQDQRSIQAAMQYVRSNIGEGSVSLHISDSSNSVLLREAVKAGINVRNPELQKDVDRLRNELGRRIVAKSHSAKSLEIERNL